MLSTCLIFIYLFTWSPPHPSGASCPARGAGQLESASRAPSRAGATAAAARRAACPAPLAWWPAACSPATRRARGTRAARAPATRPSAACSTAPRGCSSAAWAWLRSRPCRGPHLFGAHARAQGPDAEIRNLAVPRRGVAQRGSLSRPLPRLVVRQLRALPGAQRDRPAPAAARHCDATRPNAGGRYADGAAPAGGDGGATESGAF